MLEIGSKEPSPQEFTTQSTTPGSVENTDFDVDFRLIVGTENIEEAKASWQSDFTDPKDHHDDRFCYLVTGIMTGADSTLKQLLYLKSDLYEPERSIDLFEEPLEILKKELISSTIVDQDHRGTFGSCGLILVTPYENVIAAYSEDAGSHFDWEKLKKPNTIVPTIPEIMEATYQTDHNEIVLKGTSSSGSVLVKGFWAKVTENGQVVNEEGFKRMQAHALDLGLPFVEIQQESMEWNDIKPELYRDSEGKINFIAVNRKGLRYCFSLNAKNPQFYIVDDRVKSRAMTREEFDYAFDVLSQELPESDKINSSISFESIPSFFRDNPLPEIMYDRETDEIRSIAIDRGWVRYLVYGTNSNEQPLVIDSSENSIMRRMTAEDFEYMKTELLKDLGGKDLGAFLKIIPYMEEKFTQ